MKKDFGTFDKDEGATIPKPRDIKPKNNDLSEVVKANPKKMPGGMKTPKLKKNSPAPMLGVKRGK